MRREEREAPRRTGPKPGSVKEVAMKRVYVRAYCRWRYGQRENVCQHTRRWPRQYEFQF